MAKWFVVLFCIFLAVSFVWYPVIYQNFLPSYVSKPVLQTRTDLFSLAGDLDGSLINTGSNGPTINSTWAQQFFAQLDVDRGAAGDLAPCPSLSKFAQYRFNDMSTGKDYEISHYNYENDLRSYYQGTSGSFEEEYFFPDGYTPSAYLELIQQKAPVHWQGLLNSTLTNYGYDLGKGPVIEYSSSIGTTCNSPTEVVGEGVNMTQIASGCQESVVQGTWFVIELSSVCP